MDDRKFLIKRRYARECVVCGETATRRITYLYRNARSNPNSKAFGKDDISWCSDAEQFTCTAHEKDRDSRPQSMEHCATFQNWPRFAHMFFEWSERDITSFILDVDDFLDRLIGMGFGATSDRSLPGEYDTVREALNGLLGREEAAQRAKEAK